MTSLSNEQQNGAETAFPQPSVWTGENGLHYGTPGLTKRELLAAMAMQGYCTEGIGGDSGFIAEAAVRQADALLAALEQNNG